MRGSASWRAWGGPFVTALALLVVEFFTHGPVALPEPLPAGLFLMALGGIVLSAFLGGFRSALVAVALYTLYAARFIVPRGSDLLVDISPFGLGRMLIVLAFSLAVALPTGYLKRRDDRLHARVVAPSASARPSSSSPGAS